MLSHVMRNRQHCVLLLLVCINVFCSIIILPLAFKTTPSDKSCLKSLYAWSPALDVVKYHWEKFPSHKSPFDTSRYIGQASDEIEAAWAELLPPHPVTIQPSEITIPPENRHKIFAHAHPLGHHDEETALLAIPQVFLQLNCINILRIYASKNERDFSHRKMFNGSLEHAKYHVNVCLERLRHAFMCWADTSLNLYASRIDSEGNLVRGSMDFGTLHYCRAFEAVKRWTVENGVRRVGLNDEHWADLV